MYSVNLRKTLENQGGSNKLISETKQNTKQ